MSAKHTLTFLGTGASCGVPSYYCGCAACEEALENPKAARSCSCLLISGAENTLIDASPELRTQLVQAGARDIARVLITHEHFDHVGGIPQLEYYVRLKSHMPMPLFASAEAIAGIEQQFAFMLDSLDLHTITSEMPGLVFDGVSYTPLPACHAQGTFGFLIETAATRLAYFPDTGPLEPAVTDQLQNLDYLIVDATFNGRNWMPASHFSIDEAIAFAQTLAPRTTYLTHLAMHYDTPITTAQLEEKLKPYEGSIKLPHDGLSLTI